MLKVKTPDSDKVVLPGISCGATYNQHEEIQSEN
jgi:hypothetical protein